MVEKIIKSKMLILFFLLFCIVFTSPVRGQTTYDSTYDYLGLGLCCFMGLLNILFGAWMFKDAEKRGKSKWAWLFAGLFLSFIGLVIWLVVRPSMEEVQRNKRHNSMPGGSSDYQYQTSPDRNQYSNSPPHSYQENRTYSPPPVQQNERKSTPRTGYTPPPPTKQPMKNEDDKERIKTIRSQMKELDKASKYISTSDIQGLVEWGDLDSAEKMIKEKKEDLSTIKKFEEEIDELKSEGKVNVEDLEREVRNGNFERAKELIQEKEGLKQLIPEIKENISELKKQERMIDTKDVEKALEKGYIDRAYNLMQELKRDFEEYQKVIEDLEILDHRKSRLASKLADGEISNTTFTDARQDIENEKYDLEERLERLRRKVIYEDYKKPF